MAEPYDLAGMADPELLARHARRSFSTGTHTGHGVMSQPETSVREAHYKGHRIRVETTYRITVDDQPVTGHVMVGQDGRVHYHSIPNQQFDSAVDMVKRIIDLTPPDRVPGGNERASGGDPTTRHHHPEGQHENNPRSGLRQ
jgi:hypothetical protein